MWLKGGMVQVENERWEERGIESGTFCSCCCC